MTVTESVALPRKTSRKRGQIIDPLGVLGLVLLFGLWWGVSSLEAVRAVILPSPAAVFRFIQQNFFESNLLYQFRVEPLWDNLLFTTGSVWIGLGIACIISVPLGFLSKRREWMQAVSDPIFITLGTLPILIISPFFLIWFGTSRTAQIALITVYSSAIMYTYAQRSIENLNPIFTSAARMYGASTFRIVRDVHLRGTLPELLGGLRIALAGSWGLAAIAELLGAPAGIGKVISALAPSSNSAGLLAATLVLAVMAFLTDQLLVVLFRIINRWRPALK